MVGLGLGWPEGLTVYDVGILQTTPPTLRLLSPKTLVQSFDLEALSWTVYSRTRVALVLNLNLKAQRVLL